MRFLFLLGLWSVHVKTFSLFNQHFSLLTWKSQSVEDENLTGYKKGVTVTGRVFITMLGFPAKCERQGISHACTLSFACWLVGGSSEPGCGGNPWIVACCVTVKTIQQSIIPYEDYSDFQQSVGYNEYFGPILQKRTDDFPLDNTIEEPEEQCGISSERIFSKRIIGGKQASFGQFPWQAYIKVGTFQCGGVLVSRKFVATAAHCILTASLDTMFVYLGELDTQDTGIVQEFAPADLHKVRQKIVHPKFRYRVTQPDRFDLALLELAAEATTDFHISPICLPEKEMDVTGKEAVVAGWGKVKKTSEITGTNILRSATVPILDIKDCILWHKLKKINVDLHEEMLCAGHENGNQDACLGDSGGPLIILEKGKWTLVGIISAGFGCGEPHQPGIYHKITSTVEWIKNVTSQ